jgi:hypothetical protein
MDCAARWRGETEAVPGFRRPKTGSEKIVGFRERKEQPDFRLHALDAPIGRREAIVHFRNFWSNLRGTRGIAVI